MKLYACREYTVGSEDDWWVGLYKDKPFGNVRIASSYKHAWLSLGGLHIKKDRWKKVEITIKVVA
jgi:hypothetical protein